MSHKVKNEGVPKRWVYMNNSHPIASLANILVIAKDFDHQGIEESCGIFNCEIRFSRQRRPCVARQGWGDDVECRLPGILGGRK